MQEGHINAQGHCSEHSPTQCFTTTSFNLLLYILSLPTMRATPADDSTLQRLYEQLHEFEVSRLFYGPGAYLALSIIHYWLAVEYQERYEHLSHQDKGLVNIHWEALLTCLHIANELSQRESSDTASYCSGWNSQQTAVNLFTWISPAIRSSQTALDFARSNIPHGLFGINGQVLLDKAKTNADNELNSLWLTEPRTPVLTTTSRTGTRSPV